jgi:hypothetical protein
MNIRKSASRPKAEFGHLSADNRKLEQNTAIYCHTLLIRKYL